MDPRERADAALARARARGSFVVTPESAISPMDATSTLQIPRAVVSAIDNDPESTLVVPAISAEDERPAITQEASTQVLASPPPAARRHSEPPRPPRPGPPLSWAPPRVEQPPEPQPVEGLVPTVKQPPTARSTLSQRLDG